MSKESEINKKVKDKRKKEQPKSKSKEVKDFELGQFIDLQKSYRRQFMETIYKKNEVEELQIQITSGNIQIKWHGGPMPEKIAKSFFNLLVYNYRENAKELEGLKQQLVKKGMTNEDLVKLIEDDKYKSELK